MTGPIRRVENCHSQLDQAGSFPGDISTFRDCQVATIDIFTGLNVLWERKAANRRLEDAGCSWGR